MTPELVRRQTVGNTQCRQGEQVNKSRAITLVEILVVTAIVGTLLAILVFALRPSKERGLEAHVRAELQQLCTAINLYMEDHDDGYPISLRAVKAQFPEAPIEPTRVKERLPGCGSGNLNYNYMRNIGFLRGEARYPAKYPFDIKVDPIVSAFFFCKRTGVMKEWFALDGEGNPVRQVGEEVLDLGVRLDGYVGWFDTNTALWSQEFALKAHRL